MKGFIQSIFKSTEERIKNPFIGAFMTSWFLFNWKPVLFLAFSSKVIESKIDYVEKTFSNIGFVLLYPLLSAVFYVLILPYINLLFDELLRYSFVKRNVILINKQKQAIENQRELAIEEIKLEEAKTDFRERNSHNKLVENLQNKIKELEINSEQEKMKNSELLNELKTELKNRDDIASHEIRNFEKQYSNSRNEIKLLNEKIFEKDKQIQDLRSMLNNESLRNEMENNRVIRLENGERIIEKYEGDRKYYFNYDTNKRYEEKDIEMLMDKYR